MSHRNQNDRNSKGQNQGADNKGWIFKESYSMVVFRVVASQGETFAYIPVNIWAIVSARWLRGMMPY
jgi:hypothetical protein